MDRIDDIIRSRKRGSTIRPHNRFARFYTEQDLEQLLEEDAKFELSKKVPTQFITDNAKTILTKNNSPDISFTYSVNIYRGCEHGCSYCYARPTHENFGLDAGLGFETNIFVKANAPELLKKALEKKSWTKEPIVFSGVTDCYQPAERRFQLMRECLKVMLEMKNPLAIITKNILLLRDLDLLKELAKQDLVHIFISLTTLDEDLARVMEPRTAVPNARLQAISTLRQNNIPVSILMAPVIPGLNDMEIPQLLAAASDAGADAAGYVLLRLPLSVKPVFFEWLDRHFPEKASHIKTLLSDCREGEFNQNQFGQRMRGSGAYWDTIAQTFKVFSKKYFNS